MKKLLLLLICFPIVGFASPKAVVEKSPVVKKAEKAGVPEESEKPTQIPDFPIYVEAKKESKVLERATLNTPLVTIFKEKDWVKVGDRSNGKVGWVFEKDYQKAVDLWRKQRTQSVWINVTENPQEGLSVVAYKNGKKLNDEQAKVLYEKMKKQQKARQERFKKWFESTNTFFKADNDSVFMAPLFGDM